MISQMESRLTIIVIMGFSISFWLLVTIILDLFENCHEFGLMDPVNVNSLKYHFIGALILKSHEKQEFDLRICDACILNQYWVITAAQCLSVFEKKENKFVRLRSDTPERKTGKEHEIKKYLAHKNYNQNQTGYDIALIQVTTPFVGASVSYADLPDPNYLYVVNSTAIVLSWGIESYTNSLDTKKFKKLQVLLLNHDYCTEKYRDLNETITSEVLCAGFYTGRNKLCEYQSGTLLVQNKMVIGLASRGARCGFNELPGIHVKLAYFRESIQDVLDNADNEAYNNSEFISNIVR